MRTEGGQECGEFSYYRPLTVTIKVYFKEHAVFVSSLYWPKNQANFLRIVQSASPNKKEHKNKFPCPPVDETINPESFGDVDRVWYVNHSKI